MVKTKISVYVFLRGLAQWITEREMEICQEVALC